MLAAQLNELGVSQGPEAPPRPNRQHKAPSSTSNSGQPASSNDQNNKQMPQSSSILDQVSITFLCIPFFFDFQLIVSLSAFMRWSFYYVKNELYYISLKIFLTYILFFYRLYPLKAIVMMTSKMQEEIMRGMMVHYLPVIHQNLCKSKIYIIYLVKMDKIYV